MGVVTLFHDDDGACLRAIGCHEHEVGTRDANEKVHGSCLPVCTNTHTNLFLKQDRTGTTKNRTEFLTVLQCPPYRINRINKLDLIGTVVEGSLWFKGRRFSLAFSLMGQRRQDDGEEDYDNDHISAKEYTYTTSAY